MPGGARRSNAPLPLLTNSSYIMGTIIVGLIAVALLIYLLFAMIYPENF